MIAALPCCWLLKCSRARHHFVPWFYASHAALKRLTKEVMIQKNQMQHLMTEREFLSEYNTSSNSSMSASASGSGSDATATASAVDSAAAADSPPLSPTTTPHNKWLVQLFCTFQDSHSLYMVMEYLPGGDLMTLLIRENIFSEQATKFYVSELVLAIEWIHKLGA